MLSQPPAHLLPQVKDAHSLKVLGKDDIIGSSLPGQAGSDVRGGMGAEAKGPTRANKLSLDKRVKRGNGLTKTSSLIDLRLGEPSPTQGHGRGRQLRGTGDGPTGCSDFQGGAIQKVPGKFYDLSALLR